MIILIFIEISKFLLRYLLQICCILERVKCKTDLVMQMAKVKCLYFVRQVQRKSMKVEEDSDECCDHKIKRQLFIGSIKEQMWRSVCSHQTEVRDLIKVALTDLLSCQNFCLQFIVHCTFSNDVKKGFK